ncbi:MAG: cag pathogenicity island protein 24 [Luteibaculaceae bacterium]|jgi:cag pathogenicity island protein 24
MSQKFRPLTEEELDVLRPDFVQFLASNSIDAQSWEKMLKEDVESVNTYMDVFSNLVFEKALEKMKYIEHIAGQDARFFKCGEEEIELIGVKIDTPETPILEALKNPNTTPGKIEVYSAKKGYQPNKQEELFRMLNSGGSVSNGEWFEKLKAKI